MAFCPIFGYPTAEAEHNPSGEDAPKDPLGLSPWNPEMMQSTYGGYGGTGGFSSSNGIEIKSSESAGRNA